MGDPPEFCPPVGPAKNRRMAGSAIRAAANSCAVESASAERFWLAESVAAAAVDMDVDAAGAVPRAAAGVESVRTSRAESGIAGPDSGAGRMLIGGGAGTRLRRRARELLSPVGMRRATAGVGGPDGRAAGRAEPGPVAVRAAAGTVGATAADADAAGLRRTAPRGASTSAAGAVPALAPDTVAGTIVVFDVSEPITPRAPADVRIANSDSLEASAADRRATTARCVLSSSGMATDESRRAAHAPAVVAGGAELAAWSANIPVDAAAGAAPGVGRIDDAAGAGLPT
jgi:hypothetical protein